MNSNAYVDGYETGNKTNYRNILPNVPRLNSGKQVSLLLGTDRHLDEGTDEQETRVGITPIHTRMLREWLSEVGVPAQLYVVEGAGLGSGYSDKDYVSAGGRIIAESELARMIVPPDVVHALKEPALYEATIPGPFIRVGALHTGTFSETSGTAVLLKRGHYCAILDGSAIGKCSYRLTNGFPIPIRSSMSVIAGEIAAEMIAENANKALGPVVIAGGGAVGTAATRRLLELASVSNQPVSILIVDEREERCEQLRNEFPDTSRVEVKQSGYLSDDDVRGAVALVLAPFVEREAAPKVVDLASLGGMVLGGIIIDVSIDEGGCIACPDGLSTKAAIDALGLQLTYRADTHMPRRQPRRASDEHGNAVLPYLGALLYLASREGGAVKAIHHIERCLCPHTGQDYFEALVCDLANGIAFKCTELVTINNCVVKAPAKIEAFLQSHNFLAKVTGESGHYS